MIKTTVTCIHLTEHRLAVLGAIVYNHWLARTTIWFIKLTFVCLGFYDTVNTIQVISSRSVKHASKLIRFQGMFSPPKQLTST